MSTDNLKVTLKVTLEDIIINRQALLNVIDRKFEQKAQQEENEKKSRNSRQRRHG